MTYAEAYVTTVTTAYGSTVKSFCQEKRTFLKDIRRLDQQVRIKRHCILCDKKNIDFYYLDFTLNHFALHGKYFIADVSDVR